MDSIIERIERQAGIPGLLTILAERLSPTDLQSLLLEVYRVRTDQMNPAKVLRDYQSNRFVHPSPVAPASALRWESIALSLLPREFQPLTLSPVCPLGTNSVVAAVDQNWAVATARNTEVVSDATNVLALECAVRRRELLRRNTKSPVAVHLAASHRLLRAQRYEAADALPHFASVVLCSAGRDTGNLRFELSALARHITYYLRSLRAYVGPDVPLHVSATDLRSDRRMGVIEERLFPQIRLHLEDVSCRIDEKRPSGRGYYRDLCFHIHATTASRRKVELVDGGSVDWTRKLLSNEKERLVISGIGSERLCTELPERPDR